MHADELKRGFLAGVLAGVPMIGVMLLLASLTGLPTLPDLFADPVLFLIPGPLFGRLIDALQFSAKTLLLAALLEGQLLVCGLVGRFWAGRSAGRPASDHWRSAAATVGTIYLAVISLGLGLAGQGIFGAALPTGMALGLGGLLLIHLTYAVSLVLLFRWIGRRPVVADAPASLRRRRLLAAVGAASLAAIGGGTLWRVGYPLGGGATVAGASAGGVSGELSDEVTPTDRFYAVSKNFSDPRVDPGPWTLAIDGAVEQPFRVTLDELRALPPQEQYFTLSCVSNVVGGDLIGNAHWRGVPLRSLIERAQPRGGIRKVVFYAADGYTDSIAYDKATFDRTLVAYEMNGQPLNARHGAPARLLIPGIYGMKNVKWATRVELLTREFRGYWQERGWSDPAPVQTFSRIDVPLGGRTVAGQTRIGGIAHAGDRAVKRVEVTTDGGKSWVDAVLRPPLGPDAWTIWTYDWTPPGPGQYTLEVRATDGLDRVQVPDRGSSFPDGPTGWHSVTVRAI